MEQLIVGLFYGASGYDLLLWSVVASGLVFSLINERGFRQMKDSLFVIGIALLVIFSVIGWITHVIHCLIQAKYLLLIAGAFIAPVGVIHGIGILFGVSW